MKVFAYLFHHNQNSCRNNSKFLKVQNIHERGGNSRWLLENELYKKHIPILLFFLISLSIRGAFQFH